VKAIYRRGLAKTYMSEFDEGKKDLLKAHELCPNDAGVKDAFRIFKERKKEY
jgi:hypothetical protein